MNRIYYRKILYKINLNFSSSSLGRNRNRLWNGNGLLIVGVNRPLVGHSRLPLFTVRNSGCGKVMFLYLSVILFTVGGVHGRGGMRGRGGAWTAKGGGMYGKGHVWQEGCAWQGECVVGEHAWWGEAWCGACVEGGSCTARDMCGGQELRAWQQRWPLQRTVRIILECILVSGLYPSFNS